MPSRDFFGVNIGGHARVAEGADQDRVEVVRPSMANPFPRDCHFVGRVAVGPPSRMR